MSKIFHLFKPLKSTAIIVLIISLLFYASSCTKSLEANQALNPETETVASTENNSETGDPLQPAQKQTVNPPRLVQGMKAIRWENNDWIEVQMPEEDTSWYEYKQTSGDASSRWANARTTDGSSWVWIPRYAYKITDQHVEILFLKENTNTDIQGKDLPEGYIVHPAFTSQVEAGGWDSEITGFWVSKFEAAREENTLVFKANAYAYNNLTIGEAYTLSKELPYEGAYPHLIKASEWGAVAYLATSSYGRDGVEVSINLTKITLEEEKTTAVTAGGNGKDGLAASAQDALVNNALQSTTGNVYGVYDMAGGLWERNAAYIHNGNANLLLNGKAIVEDGNPLLSNKYKTVYDYDQASDTMESNYNLNKSFKGDAMMETSKGVGKDSWFGDESSFMWGNAVFLHRGGSTIDDPGVGIFNFANTHGQAGNPLGFRSTIIVP